MTQQESKKCKTEWHGQPIRFRAVKMGFIFENYSFRKELDESSQKSRKEIRDLLKQYNEEKEESQALKKDTC